MTTGMIITGKDFCCGLVLTQGIVTRSAPMLRYMQAWPAAKVRGYALLRGWRVDEEMPETVSAPCGGRPGNRPTLSGAANK